MSSEDFSDDDDFFESIRRHEQTKAASVLPPQQSGANDSAEISSFPIRTTQTQGSADISKLPSDIRSRLYQADGEIAILKSQLEQAKTREYEETKRLKESFQDSRMSMEEQIKALKFTVQKLEDEKKFLDNQVRSGYVKKRKVDTDGTYVSETQTNKPGSATISATAYVASGTREAAPKPRQKIIRVSSDTTLLTEYLWRLSINGSTHTTMDYLGRICLRDPITISGFTFASQLPISGIILEYLINKKDLRLDKLIDEFFNLLENLVSQLIADKTITCVPFLLTLIHGVLGFKPSAISANALVDLTKCMVKIVNEFKTNLDHEDRELFNYNKTPQQLIIEKFILVTSMDIIESIMVSCNLHTESQLGKKLFHKFGINDLCNQFLPKNQEALITAAQVNIVYNIVEIFNNYYEVNEQEEMAPETVQTLLNLYLMGIPLKDDFRFYGLNRCIGNNDDYKKIDKVVFNDQCTEILQSNLIILPNPIPKLDPSDKYTIKFQHEYHVLQLQLHMSEMIENYMVNKADVALVKSIESVKLMTTVVNLEQQYIIRSPRSMYTYSRVRLIGNYIRILNHLFKMCKQLNEIINIEALNELTIVLSRIAFSSDSQISAAGSKLYKDLRMKNYKLVVINATTEEKARLAHNITISHPDKAYLSEIESYSANGLEVPYDSETIELSREILGLCIDNQVADNLYINMNGPDSLEDMDLDKF